MGDKKRSIISVIMFLGIISMNSAIPSAKTLFGNGDVIKFISLIQSGNYGKADEMLKKGVDMNFKSKEGITPLYYFFLKDDYKSFKKLLELGADPNVDPDGVGLYRLIDYSMRIKDDRYFKLLLEYNADIDYIPKYGDTLLESVLYSTVDIKYLKMLFEYGIKVENDPNSSFWASSPLLIALSGREYKKVILLLDYNSNLLKDKRVENSFIKHLEENSQAPGSQLLKDQQELVKYLKDKFNIDVKLKYPEGRKVN